MALTTKRRRHPACILSIIGPGGSGKTWAALHGPSPIQIVSVDPNTRFICEQVFGEDDGKGHFDGCTLHEIELPKLAFEESREEVQTMSEKSWSDLVDTFRPLALDTEPEDAGTIVLDTADEIYSISMLAEFGKLDQIPPDVRKNMMGRVNTRYKQLVMGLRDAGWVVVLLHRPREVWVDAVERTATGIKDVRKQLTGPFDWERQGYKDTNTLCSIEVVVAADHTRDGKLSAHYGMKYVKNSHRPILTGQEFWGRQAPAEGAGKTAVSSVSFIGLQSFPGTREEGWR